ncbi:MAG: Y-family DNA polymerase [Bacteroidota bacterium]|nr:Y-family DNA polymerase [Bacteroidota bacterium]
MRKKLFALVDCNNFYVSCERAFNASIQKRPVVVLSNNDGCIVARSNEAKKLGFKMGQPIFQCKNIINQHNVQVFSSNYSLYADMSARVTHILSRFSPLLEKYSIDEAFLELTNMSIDDLTEFGQEIRSRVMQHTGIPVSVGIAATKCLTKIATEIVKKDPSFGGVLDISAYENPQVDALLERVLVEDVWGIGRKYTLFLNNYGVRSAKDLKYADQKWIRRYLTITGERIVLELNGTSCMPLETDAQPKKGIMCSKSFGKEITDKDGLREAVATYTARAAEKLRQQESQAAEITIFINTNRFKSSDAQYSNSFTIEIPYPTAYTPELIKCAIKGLNAIYRDGYKYKKAGVYLTKISSEESVQPDLFGEFSIGAHNREARLMYIVDAINRIYGRDTIFFATQGVTRNWAMRQRKLSQHFTTKWDELLKV